MRTPSFNVPYLSRIAFLAIVFLAFLFSSCMQNETGLVNSKTTPVPSSLSLGSATTNSAPGGGSSAYITLTNGHFISSFGGGIDFGGSFPHPTGGNNGDDVGIPYGATFSNGDGYVTTFASHLIVILNNPHHYPTGELTVSFNIETGKTDIEVPEGEVFQNPAAAGKVIVDHTSPTNMTIVSEEYTVNANPSSGGGVGTPTGTFVIGELIISGVDFRLCGKSGKYVSGKVTKVAAKKVSDGTPVAIGSYSLNYSRSADGNSYLITGTLGYSAGTVTVNSSISSAM